MGQKTVVKFITFIMGVGLLVWQRATDKHYRRMTFSFELGLAGVLALTGYKYLNGESVWGWLVALLIVLLPTIVVSQYIGRNRNYLLEGIMVNIMNTEGLRGIVEQAKKDHHLLDHGIQLSRRTIRRWRKTGFGRGIREQDYYRISFRHCSSLVVKETMAKINEYVKSHKHSAETNLGVDIIVLAVVVLLLMR